MIGAIRTKRGQRVHHTDKEVKGWFLTYPHLDMQPAQLLEALEGLADLPPLKEHVICRELHADGTPHCHAFVKYDRKVAWSPRRWDLPSGHHGSYEPAKSWWACKAYCKKGSDFISSLDLDAAQSKKASRNFQLIQEAPEKLVEDGVISLFQLQSLINNRKLLEELQCPLLPTCAGFIPNTFGLLLPIRQEKQRHFWFWSATPNKGKTIFLQTLLTQYRSYLYNVNEKYQDPHPKTQFVLFDEYSTARVLLTDLNGICDGTFRYSQKGKAAVTLERPTVLICGNRRPEEVYTSESSWPLINARFVVFCLDDN